MFHLHSAPSRLWGLPFISPWILLQNPGIPLSISILLCSKWPLWTLWDVPRADSCKSQMERKPLVWHGICNGFRWWLWSRHHARHAGSMCSSLFLIPWSKTPLRIPMHPRTLVYTRIARAWPCDWHVACQAWGRRRKAAPWGDTRWFNCSRCPSFTMIWFRLSSRRF
jgi:hypothetical protein